MTFIQVVAALMIFVAGAETLGEAWEAAKHHKKLACALLLISAFGYAIAVTNVMRADFRYLETWAWNR